VAKGVKVLCVDDEPRVLEGLALHLHRSYDVSTATSGRDGLAVLEKQGPFAVVMADMRMPGMDGAAFLSQSRVIAPDATRMLLTGDVDVKAAIDAVNQGQIFRFLTKPCPPEVLRQAFEAAVEQHRLVTAERVLLEETLHGSIQALVDVLALTNPAAFGRATRLKELVAAMADKLGLEHRWQFAVAAMLSQIGSIVLPAETAERHYYGRPLSPEEQLMVSRSRAVVEQLLGKIPRLEVVRGILSTYFLPFRPTPPNADATRRAVDQGANLLRVAFDFDSLEMQGQAATLALDTLRGRLDRYDPRALEVLGALKTGEAVQVAIRELPMSAVREGMVFAEDVKTGDGVLLAARGYVVTAGFVERARNFRAGYVREPIRVILR